MTYCRCHCRHNPDANLRALERLALATGDPEDQARYITARLRAGEIPQLNVEIASELGHPVAQMIMPRPIVDWSAYGIRTNIFERLVDSGQRFLVIKVAAQCVKRVLLQRYPDDLLPLRTVEATIQWAVAGEELFSRTVEDAADESYAAADGLDRQRAHIYDAAAYIAFSALRGGPSKKGVKIGWYASSAPAYSILDAANAANNREHEFQWQANYLAEVLLGLQPI